MHLNTKKQRVVHKLLILQEFCILTNDFSQLVNVLLVIKLQDSSNALIEPDLFTFPQIPIFESWRTFALFGRINLSVDEGSFEIINFFETGSLKIQTVAHDQEVYWNDSSHFNLVDPINSGD